jgi:hypothetical protein
MQGVANAWGNATEGGVNAFGAVAAADAAASAAAAAGIATVDGTFLVAAQNDAAAWSAGDDAAVAKLNELGACINGDKVTADGEGARATAAHATLRDAADVMRAEASASSADVAVVNQWAGKIAASHAAVKTAAGTAAAQGVQAAGELGASAVGLYTLHIVDDP